MKYIPCEAHRRSEAELARRLQETTTPEQLRPFGDEQREQLRTIKACPDCVVRA